MARTASTVPRTFDLLAFVESTRRLVDRVSTHSTPPSGYQTVSPPNPHGTQRGRQQNQETSISVGSTRGLAIFSLLGPTDYLKKSLSSCLLRYNATGCRCFSPDKNPTFLSLFDPVPFSVCAEYCSFDYARV